MDQVLAFINSPYGGFVIALVVGAFLREMPKPPAGSLWYLWLYRAVQRILSNKDLVRAADLNADTQKTFSFRAPRKK